MWWGTYEPDTWDSSTHRSSLLTQRPDWNLLLRGIKCLFIAECRNSYYTFFPVHAGRGLKPWPSQRLLHQKNIWKHRSNWMKLQPGQACVQPLKLPGAQQLEDRQKLLSWILSRACLTRYLSSSFTGLSCQGSGGEKYSSKSCLLSCWMNNFERARSIYKDLLQPCLAKTDKKIRN